jgi:Flp pilus assembly protein TadG
MLCCLPRDRRGTAVIEFALLFPLLALVLFGILGYGQYFLLAHSAQQLANDAARATVAGLSDTERRTLAAASVARELASLPEIARYGVTTDVSEAAQLVTVRVRVDASTMPLMHMAWLPMPPATIDRRAVMRPGGES